MSDDLAMYDAAMAAFMFDATDPSKRELEGASSLVVLKTGRDRLYSLNCCVCGQQVKLRQPVVSKFIGTWNQALRGGREAVLKTRHHCETTHPNEYIWWAIPRGGDAVNETASASMDELMRYVLDRTATKLGIHSMMSVASNNAWSLEMKALALALFIGKRHTISMSILEHASSRVLFYKKLFKKSDYAIIRKQAVSHLDIMAHSLTDQCRQYRECIFDNVNYDAYINRLQLCYFERGRWRRLTPITSSDVTSDATLFGSLPIPVHSG